MVLPRTACGGPSAGAQPGDAGGDILGQRLARRRRIANPPRQHATRVIEAAQPARLGDGHRIRAGRPGKGHYGRQQVGTPIVGVNETRYGVAHLKQRRRIHV